MFNRLIQWVEKVCAAMVHVFLGPRGQLLALMLAGPVACIFAVWLIHIVAGVWWPLALRPQQLQILGYALFGMLGLIYVVIIALSAGLIKGVRLHGLGFDADVSLGDDNNNTEVKDVSDGK